MNTNEKNEKRYDDSVKLALALGEIDDKFIEEARTPSPIFLTTKRLMIIAASLLVVLVVGIAAIAFIPMFAQNNNNDTDVTEKFEVGDVVIKGDSSITFVDNTDNKLFTYLITFEEDVEEFDLYMYGQKLLLTDGVPSAQNIVASTSTDLPSGFTPAGSPKIIVNGSISASLPKKAGTYLVTVDATSLVTSSTTVLSTTLNSCFFTYFGAKFDLSNK